ncbi:hypothetical protein FBZ84_11725 [Azospirillum baldaniorum]|uniref:hypothetical protein n=1 Tax=Azospirillum baldaniorum TaxID=1064539 RepID=UPI0011A23B3C|nr:hypothetical protein [Azospirillum baldaniorum]TWA58634.1 hypothetical protein FBZ84_11725 [Azospirillum baldaniorum]
MTDALPITPSLAAPLKNRSGKHRGAWPFARGLVNILRGGRCGPPPQQPAETQVDIHRQPLRTALDWHQDMVALWRRHPTFGPGLHDDLKSTGLLPRCVILTARDGGPLCFRYIGEPTRRVFGDRWADQNIGKPHLEDVHGAYAQAIDAQYREAVEGGEPVYNHLVITGLPRPPVNYRHLLFGWSLGHRRQALLALIDS